MSTSFRSVGRFARYWAWVFALAAAFLGGAWLIVLAIPFLAEGTKAFWELIAGQDAVRIAIIGLAGICLIYLLAFSADVAWRGVYLTPTLGDDAQDLRKSRIERLIMLIAMAAAAAVILLLPGAVDVVGTVGRWLPERGSPGFVGLAAILALVVGSIVFVGEFLDFSWRSRPGHDLGRPVSGMTAV